jgi:hypothetical protein
MDARLNALFVMAMIVILSLALPACSPEQPADPGLLPDAEDDLNGRISRLSNGKPDLTGVWERPYVRDITQSFTNPDGIGQVGEPELPFTEWGQTQWDSHDPANDYAGACLPYGFPRAIVARHPMQLLHHNDFMSFLFEQNSWFTVVPIDGRPHPADAMDNPTWFGNSVGHWEEDTLVIDTIGVNGYTNLDTVGHPHSTQMHLVQRFTRTDFGHINYEMIIDDPKTYSRPIKQVQTWVLRPDWEIMEYSCAENNLGLIANGTIKWTRPENVD